MPEPTGADKKGTRKGAGLQECYEMSCEEIGKELGLTQQRVQQIEAGALKKLRDCGDIALLMEYLKK